MKFSVWPLFSRPWDELVAFAQAAEARGWHGLWYADHYMTDHPDGEPTGTPALEAWEIMAALAASTERLRLGTLVSPTTMHHPALLAKRAATVDQISHGRLTLGIGAGIDEFIVPDFTLGSTPEMRLASYDRFSAEVIALLA